MANVKISGLPAASTPLTGAELVPIVQSGVTSQTTVGDFGAAVSYTPSGTGAITTTVQAKLRETVSVKDFGAVGDGTTDDTAAIQAAFTYAQNISSCVYIPYGTYLLNSVITIGTNVKGIVSNGGVIERNSSAANNLLVLPASDFTIQGLEVNGNSSAFTIADPTLYIDVVTKNAKVIIVDCSFKNACGTSIGGQAKDIQVIGCRFDEWLDHAIYFSGTTTPSNANAISIVGNAFRHGSGTDNGCLKFRNNVTNVTVDGNVFTLLSSVPFVQDDQGGSPTLGDGLTYFNKRINISNNSGDCVYFYGKLTKTPVTDVATAKSVTTIEGNSVTCSFFVYLGTATGVSIGDINVQNNTIQGTMFWFRGIDNSSYSNTINVQGNILFGSFITCDTAMPSYLTVQSNTFYITSFFIYNSVADSDTSSKVIKIENNSIIKSGTVMVSILDHYRLQQNTTVYVLKNYISNVSFITSTLGDGPLYMTIDDNVSTGGAITTSNSQEFTLAAGNILISNNTFGGRLMLENANTKSSCMLTRYNTYIFNNRTDNVAQVVYTFGAPVTGYAGANKFYSQGNFGVGSTVSNGYPAGAKAVLPAITL